MVNPYIHSRIGFFGGAIFIEDFLLAGAELAKKVWGGKIKVSIFRIGVGAGTVALFWRWKAGKRDLAESLV